MKKAFVHATALVESEDIGQGTRIWAFAHILDGAVIGANCNIGDHCFIEGGVVVGDNVTIKNGNELWEGVTLGDGVFVGPNVTFTNDRYPRSPRLAVVRKRYQSKQWLVPTVVAEGASIGAAAVLLAGVRIGRYSMVAAGAVVTHDVPDNALVIGSPARVVGWVCQCGQKLSVNKRSCCETCGWELLSTGKMAQTQRRPTMVEAEEWDWKAC